MPIVPQNIAQANAGGNGRSPMLAPEQPQTSPSATNLLMAAATMHELGQRSQPAVKPVATKRKGSK